MIGWMFAIFILGVVIGRATQKNPDVELAVNRFLTRSRAAHRIAGESNTLAITVAAQAKLGVIDPQALAALVQNVADLNYLASDMVDDQAALLSEVTHGGTKAND